METPEQAVSFLEDVQREALKAMGDELLAKLDALLAPKTGKIFRSRTTATRISGD